MFNPSREQVRQFFIEAWDKHQSGHLEDLRNADAVNQDYAVEQGRSNPFLHLSMHLAINEQLSIDQPPGIKGAYQRLLTTHDPHAAAHTIMEALGEVIWEAQRLGTPLNNERYIELILRHSTRD